MATDINTSVVINKQAEHLVFGYIRDIQKLIDDRIIPTTIIELCITFYWQAVNTIFCMQEPGSSSDHIFPIINIVLLDEGKHLKCKIKSLIPDIKEVNAFSTFNVGFCRAEFKLPQHIVAKSNCQVNDSNLYDILFVSGCGGYRKNNDCHSYIINPADYTSSDNNINMFHYKLPSLPIGDSGTFLVYSKKYGLITIGGNSKDASAVLNLNEDKWTWRKLPMQTQRGLLSASMITEDKIICCGGYRLSAQKYYKSCDVYDLNTKKWKRIHPMNSKRCRGGIYFEEFRNRIYIGGGKPAPTAASKTFEWYDITKDRWTSLTNYTGDHRTGSVVWNENVNVFFIASAYGNICECIDIREDKWRISEKYSPFDKLFSSQIEINSAYARCCMLLAMSDQKQQSAVAHRIPVALIASYWLRTLAKYIIREEKKIAPIQYVKYTRKKSKLFSFHIVSFIVQYSQSLFPIPFKPRDPPLKRDINSDDNDDDDDDDDDYDWKGTTIVIEHGSSSIRAGFSGDTCPSVNIPSLIAIKKVANKDDEIIIGNEILNLIATKQTSGITIKKVIERGKIVEWDYIKLIWKYILKQFDITSIKVHIIDAKGVHSRQDFEKMTQIFFEELNGNQFIIWKSPIMSLYASGRTNGLVVQCGYGLTQVIPLYDGYVLPHAAKIVEWGKYDLELDNNIDYKTGFKQIEIGKLIVTAIKQSDSDSDIQQMLANRIIIAGGNSMYDGFKDFIFNQIKIQMKILMKNKQLNINILASPERASSSFIGGSIIGTMS